MHMTSQVQTNQPKSTLQCSLGLNSKKNSENAIYKDKVRALSDNKDFVNEAQKDHKEKEEKFKDTCTNFRSFGLQQPENFNDITLNYWLAIVEHLASAG